MVKLRNWLLAMLLALVTAPAAFAEEEKAEGGEAAKAAVEGPIFVDISPLALSVMSENDVQQMITLVVALEVPDMPTAEKVKSRAPKLTDAYIQRLYREIARKRLVREGMLDMEEMKLSLTKVTDDVLGKGTVDEVLVQWVTQTPL